MSQNHGEFSVQWTLLFGRVRCSSSGCQARAGPKILCHPQTYRLVDVAPRSLDMAHLAYIKGLVMSHVVLAEWKNLLFLNCVQSILSLSLSPPICTYVHTHIYYLYIYIYKLYTYITYSSPVYTTLTARSRRFLRHGRGKRTPLLVQGWLVLAEDDYGDSGFYQL